MRPLNRPVIGQEYDDATINGKGDGKLIFFLLFFFVAGPIGMESVRRTNGKATVSQWSNLATVDPLMKLAN